MRRLAAAPTVAANCHDWDQLDIGMGIDSMNAKDAPLGDVTARLMKVAKLTLIPALTTRFNKCLSQGWFRG